MSLNYWVGFGLRMLNNSLCELTNVTKNKVNKDELSSNEKSLLLELTHLDREFFARCKALYSKPKITDGASYDQNRP